MRSDKKKKFQTDPLRCVAATEPSESGVYYAADAQYYHTDSSEAELSIDEKVFGSPTEDPLHIQQLARLDPERSACYDLDRDGSVMTSISLHHPDSPNFIRIPAHSVTAASSASKNSIGLVHSLPFATESPHGHPSQDQLDAATWNGFTLPAAAVSKQAPLSSTLQQTGSFVSGISLASANAKVTQSYRPPMQQFSGSNGSVKHPFFESALWPKDKGFSGSGSSRKNSRDPLSEPLLAPTRLPAATARSDTHERSDSNDAAVSCSYWIHMALFFFIGFFNFLVSKKPVTELIPFSSLYETLLRSSGVFFSSILASTLISVFWLFMLRNYAALLIWSAIAFVPIGGVLFAAWALSGLVAATSSWPLLACSAAGSVAFCVLFILWVRRHSQRVQVSISVTRATCEILNSHSGIFYVSTALLLCYFAYICVWTVFFVHLCLLGSEDPEWHLYRYVYLIQLYFLVSLFWTTAVFGNLQKSMIAAVVSSCQRERHDVSGHRHSGTAECMQALHFSLTRGFGPICYGALVLYSVRAVRLVVAGYKKFAISSQPRLHQAALGLASVFVRSVERLIERFTYNAIYYSAMHGGLGFLASGEAVGRLYRRHLILLISSDYVSHFLFFISSATFAALSALSIYLYNYTALGDATDPDSNLSVKTVLFSASLFGTLTYACLSFVGSIVADAMDAAFLLYLLGLESPSGEEPSKWKLEARSAAAFEALVEREAVRIVDEPVPDSRTSGLGV